jgi:FtsP/CotA-like multicopper oxidase with cupredoxin domain
VVYNLYATDGYYELPDGQPLYFYGLAGGREGQDLIYQTRCTPGASDPLTGMAACAGSTNVTVVGGPVAPQAGPWAGQEAQFAGNAQFPAPIIYARVGDVVEIRLKNLGPALRPSAPNNPHNIHLHALDIDTAAGALLQTSLEAVPANLCAGGTTAGPEGCGPLGPAPDAGRVIVYMFSPAHAGTYLYYCHQDTESDVQMVLFGALVIYGRDDAAAAAAMAGTVAGPGQGLGGTLYGTGYDQDYVLLLGEFHLPGQQPAAALTHYWSINGLSFPQTIHVDFRSGYSFAGWLAAHPGYDPLIVANASAARTAPAGATPRGAAVGGKVLLRVLNTGLETYTLRLGGGQGQVLGSDQRGWFWTNNVPLGQGAATDRLEIGSGQTYDWLVDLSPSSDGSPSGDGSPSPGGRPYLALYNDDPAQVSSDGLVPGGMATFLVPGP